MEPSVTAETCGSVEVLENCSLVMVLGWLRPLVAVGLLVQLGPSQAGWHEQQRGDGRHSSGLSAQLLGWCDVMKMKVSWAEAEGLQGDVMCCYPICPGDSSPGNGAVCLH